jgi:small subunit ribosomal protein S10e
LPACRQWHYFYLTDEGIEYLRAYLHLPETIIPATLKKTAPATRPGAFTGEDRRGPRTGGFGRGGFDKEKGVGPAGEFKPRFSGEGGYRREGGFGRGGARPAGGEAAPAQ